MILALFGFVYGFSLVWFAYRLGRESKRETETLHKISHDLQQIKVRLTYSKRREKELTKYAKKHRS